MKYCLYSFRNKTFQHYVIDNLSSMKTRIKIELLFQGASDFSRGGRGGIFFSGNVNIEN